MANINAAESRFFIGIDLGSVTVKVVLLDSGKNVLEKFYLRHKGHPGQELLKILEGLLDKYPAEKIEAIGITGSGGKRLAKVLGGVFINEVISETIAVSSLYPAVKTIINIGGQDSKLILVDGKAEPGKFILENFSMNTLCAAGTGAFLEQQAARLGISIEDEFGDMALKSKNPPRIAGRCSVFAKSDMIHLQQKGTADYDIVAGLCYAMARNFKATIGKNMKFEKDVAFIGGVARNKGMVKAFEDVLEIGEGSLVIPENNALIGAIGAAYNVIDRTDLEFIGLGEIRKYLKELVDLDKGHEPLFLREDHLLSKEETIEFHKPGEKVNAYLGVDVGSISTNVVLIDEKKRVLAKAYLRTGGKPIDAVKRGLQEISNDIGDYVNIIGACTTGSGRYLTGDFIGADLVKDEITAHARGAIEIDKDVDTIFEIGGQDSKYISIENGAIVDFEMNKVCAAGTGSFLEEQAERLGVSIQDEFSDLALCAKDPSRCGERCTVFMESDLVHHQQKGAQKEDIIAGLSYSIAYNFINKVVEDRRIGNHIFFQGGVAYNKGVVAAFEKVTGKLVTVPPHHEVMGAFGAALLAMDNDQGVVSRFKGFDCTKTEYKITTFECHHCTNFCTINRVLIEGEGDFYYGSRCDRYDIKKSEKVRHNVPDYFAERDDLLRNTYSKTVPEGKVKARIGIPLSMTIYEDYPFWKAFFTEIGCEPVLSDPTNRKHINSGLETVVEEICFPMKVLHGHVIDLIEKKVDFIFMPQMIELNNTNPDIKGSFLCPYVQGMPDVIRTAFDFDKIGIPILRPVIKFTLGTSFLENELHKSIGKKVGVRKGKIKKALKTAFSSLEKFTASVQEAGEKALSEIKKDEIAVVIVSRPYNGCDRGINLDIPRKFYNLGIKAIPMDYLPLNSFSVAKELPNMTWWFGQRILSAAKIIRTNPNLYPVYITNFACGPDSFIIQYFRYLIGNKPTLYLEIDEHSADAGIVTRSEAFIDSLKHAVRKAPLYKNLPESVPTSLKGRKLYIPYMADHAYALKAAFKGNGLDAEVLPETDDESLEWGRKYTNSKECYPYIVTTGDMIRKLKSPDFDPEKTAFFMPASSSFCRLNHYESSQRLILRELGYPEIPVFSPDAEDTLFSDLDSVTEDFTKDAWRGVVAIDTIFKALRETKPYELNKGETEKVYRRGLEMICKTVEEKGDLVNTMKIVRREFDTIKTDKSKKKPLIGIVGELFLRWHPYSNARVVELVEELGGEAWLPPFSESLYYLNALAMHHSKMKKNVNEYLGTFIQDQYQHIVDKKLSATFSNYIVNYPEPRIKDLFKISMPYFNPIAESESPMSIGKSVNFISQGASGIINVIPFTCMPGTISAAIFKRLKEDNKDVAFLTLKYDGSGDVNIRTRVEAFMHQAAQYADMTN